jgi:hypothetical protein
MAELVRGEEAVPLLLRLAGLAPAPDEAAALAETFLGVRAAVRGLYDVNGAATATSALEFRARADYQDDKEATT